MKIWMESFFSFPKSFCLWNCFRKSNQALRFFFREMVVPAKINFGHAFSSDVFFFCVFFYLFLDVCLYIDMCMYVHICICICFHFVYISIIKEVEELHTPSLEATIANTYCMSPHGDFTQAPHGFFFFKRPPWSGVAPSGNSLRRNVKHHVRFLP